MRKLKGYEGDVFEPKSPASIQVLEEMRTVLREEGFAVARDRHKTTLRVYPQKNGTYPLLNPRLVEELGWKGADDPDDPNAEPAFREVVLMIIYSRAGDDVAERLESLELPEGTHHVGAASDDDDEDDDDSEEDDEGEVEGEADASVEQSAAAIPEPDPEEDAAMAEPTGFDCHGYLLIPLTFTDGEDGASLDLTLFRSTMRAFRVPFV